MTEYFLLLTVVVPDGAAARYQTICKVHEFPSDATRADLLKHAMAQLAPYMRAGNVMFFDAQPNHPATGRAT